MAGLVTSGPGRWRCFFVCVRECGGCGESAVEGFVVEGCCHDVGGAGVAVVRRGGGEGRKGEENGKKGGRM